MLLTSTAEAASYILQHLRELPRIRLATPLGLGKPNELLNALYERCKADPRQGLDILTALSLSPPEVGSSLLEQRFLGPFKSQHFGDDYPVLAYHRDLLAQTLPPHIDVYEFYGEAGRYIQNESAQRHHISMNYTHVARNLADRGVDLIVQLISPASASGSYSLSCNPDLTLDLRAELKARAHPCLMVGVVHPDLPFLGGPAEVSAEFFDLVVRTPGPAHQLFALPRPAIDRVDYAIGLHASSLLQDGGTLQIGIGSLSDSIVHNLLLRQRQNQLYRQLLSKLRARDLPESEGLPFHEGLYGTSEMVMDGFMHLRKSGILCRSVRDQGGETAYLHGAFFLGSKEFYAWLRSLKGEDFLGLQMSPVSKVNDIYDQDETSLRRQRVRASFCNTCMKLTLLGGAASDTLDDGRVVSGVGGQYNFVAMSHELQGARSIIMLRSAQVRGGKLRSNIVMGHEHLTIPRHLKDTFVTEYGVAQVRGQSDEQTIRSILLITDAAYQEDLIREAQKAKKLSLSYRPPKEAASNTPQTLKARLAPFEEAGLFPRYPFGSDFSPTEQLLVEALQKLKAAPRLKQLAFLARGCVAAPGGHDEALARMDLKNPRGFRAYLAQKALLGALS